MNGDPMIASDLCPTFQSHDIL